MERFSAEIAVKKSGLHRQGREEIPATGDPLGATITGCCRIRRWTTRRFITQASADKRPKTMPPRTNRWKALRRVASPGKRSSAPQYVAVRIAQAVIPERK